MAGDVQVSNGVLVDHTGVPLDLDLAIPGPSAVDSVDGQTGDVDLSAVYDAFGSANAEAIARIAADESISIALDGLEGRIDDGDAATAAHLADGTGAHAASAIAFTPHGSLSSTNIQAAIQEVRDEATGIADGNKGSLTVSGSGASWTINSGAVSEAMLDFSIATQSELDALPELAAADPAELGLATAGGVTTATILPTIARSARVANPQTSNYTLVAADAYSEVVMTHASARTITFPQDSAATIAVGSWGIISSGQGVVTMVQGTGATLRGQGTLSGEGDVCMWYKVAANTFYVHSAPGSLVSHGLTYDHTRLNTLIGIPQFSVPLSATSSAVNNSTTLVDITGMSLAVAASAVYEVYAFVPFQSGTTADIKFGWTTPSGATGTFGPATGLSSGGTDPAQLIGTFPSGTTIFGAFASTNQSAAITGTLRTTNAGTLQLQFAQNATEVVDTTIRANAFLRLTRIS